MQSEESEPLTAVTGVQTFISNARLAEIRLAIDGVDRTLLSNTGLIRPISHEIDSTPASEDGIRKSDLELAIDLYCRGVSKAVQADFEQLKTIVSRYENVLKDVRKYPSLAIRPSPAQLEVDIASAKIQITNLNQNLRNGLLDATELGKVTSSLGQYTALRASVYKQAGETIETYEKIKWDRIRGICALVAILITCSLFVIDHYFFK